MGQIDDQLTEQFYRWELRGRGRNTFPGPVALEPPFRPFAGYSLPRRSAAQEGRRHTRTSGFFDRLRQTVQPPVPAPQAEPEAEPAPEWREPEELTELQLTLPVSRAVPAAEVETFLRHVCRPSETLALEILGTAQETVPQLVASPRAATRVERALGASWPGVIVMPRDDALAAAWDETETSFAAIELALGLEFMLPLGESRADLLSGVVLALESLAEGELGLFQILFEPVRHPWAQSILATVTAADGQPVFANRPELVRAADRKTSAPLFGVVLRLAANAVDAARCWEIIADMAAPFSALARPGGNFFVPLGNADYPASDHEDDILHRLSRRSGMLLSVEELIPLLTLPTAAVSRRLRRDTAHTRPAPDSAARAGSLLLGDNRHAGTVREVRLTPEQRVRHTHLIGASGTGKSTLLFNLIRQDIENGQGVAVLDPHGDLVDRVLGIIPPERVADVVLIDPSDEEHSVGFNILAAHSDFEKSLLASDLVSVFQRLSTSWGDQMNSVLRNAILAFLESSVGGTLADLRRFLLDPACRNRFLATVTDPEIVYYWRKAFPQLTGNKSIGPVVTRLDEFLSRKPIRYMVSQQENRVDFSEVIDGGRILLAKLPQGLIGKENSHLLGSLLLSKLQQMAMSRQRMTASERRDFWCYVDEFHSFITPSMAEILTGARKYRVGLTLAHQELRQLQASDEVSGAVLANAFTRVVFRVGDADARALENGFSHFEARDLQNLEIGEAIARIERSDFDFNLSVRPPAPPDAEEDVRRAEVIAASRAKYARSRAEIETELRRKMEDDEAEEIPRAKKMAAAVAPPPPPVVEPTVPKVSEMPVTADLPKGSEKETGSVTEPTVPRKPPELGRGGPTHRELQNLIKAKSEALGFHTTLEQSVLGGKGSVDVALEKQGLRIACEISITTRVEHEVGNVLKCLEAGFPRVAFICSDAERLQQIAGAVRERVEEDAFARVGFFSPEEFFAHLQSLTVEHDARVAETAPETPAPPKDERRHGWNTKRKISSLTDDEARAAEEKALQSIAEALRNKAFE
jgi:hypothetical protein